jgi:polyvinyl alcohol dehydrogenase (cytochrome)
MAASDVPRASIEVGIRVAGDVTAFAAPTIRQRDCVCRERWRHSARDIDAGDRLFALGVRRECAVRSAMAVIGTGEQTRLVFSDQIGGVHALNARTGSDSGKYAPEAHEATRLTATRQLYNGVVFVAAASWEETRSIDPNYQCCTFRGSITRSLRASDGGVDWKTFLVPPPAVTWEDVGQAQPHSGRLGAGVWAAPTIDARRGLLYITTGDNYSHPRHRRRATRLLRLM